MKIMFIGVGLVHYFNSVLNGLAEKGEFDIYNIVAKDGRGHLGDGVFQTRDNTNFAIIELEEVISKDNVRIFVGLESVISEIQPQIIVTTVQYIRCFIFVKTISKVSKNLGIKIIMKSIPFQLQTFDSLIKKDDQTLARVPPKLRLFVRLLGIAMVRRLYLNYKRKSNASRLKKIYNFPDAHVNYVNEAYTIYGSYGVPREKIFITYNSPDTDALFEIRSKIEKQKPILPSSNHRMLHLGRLVEWKKVDMLIIAVNHLKNLFSDIQLLIVGDGPERNKLEQLALSLNVQENVKFLGGIYDLELLARYIMSSSIYVLAGMGGLSINDAMVFGRPVICSVCDGTEKHLVRENYNGLYFRENDQQDLEKKIIFLLSNPELCKTMGENSTYIIKNEINIHSVVNKYIESFKFVLQN